MANRGDDFLPDRGRVVQVQEKRDADLDADYHILGALRNVSAVSTSAPATVAAAGEIQDFRCGF